VAGYFNVGDAGYLDEEGYLFLCDRRADMVIAGDVNIYPAEIEAVLLQHPDVDDVAVFGVPNEDLGEEVKAAVQPASGTPMDEAQAQRLIAFCREQLAAYKCPRSVDFVAPARPERQGLQAPVARPVLGRPRRADLRRYR
jgi:long-chain acyl-CoA synthetase